MSRGKRESVGEREWSDEHVMWGSGDGVTGSGVRE